MEQGKNSAQLKNPKKKEPSIKAKYASEPKLNETRDSADKVSSHNHAIRRKEEEYAFEAKAYEPISPIVVYRVREPVKEDIYNYSYQPKRVERQFESRIQNKKDYEISNESDFFEEEIRRRQNQKSVKPLNVSWDEIKTTVKGTNDNNKPIDPIQKFPIPKIYENLIKKHSEENAIWTAEEIQQWENLTSKFGQPGVINSKSVDSKFGFTAVTMQNYRDFFHELLYIEEQEQILKMAQYNMYGVKMEVNGTKCILEVPGLAEKRPSVLKKDIIFVSFQNEPTVEYSGWVQEVQEKSVVIKGFSDLLFQRLARASQNWEKVRLDVRFTFSRYPFYVQHRALKLASKDTLSSLFPNVERCGKGPNFIANKNLKNIEFVNPCVNNNEEQMQAIFNILQGKSLPAPYIIFGPPGTGKTITFVEAILQVKKNFIDSHILVCAQSNSACNHISAKLYQSGECEKKEILRLTSSGRMEEVPEDIMDISGSNLKNAFNYRIIVCTLVTAGRFIASEERRKGLYQNHKFTHVFIDEAGQAAESEALIAIGLLEEPKGNLAQGQLVLGGDPKQLGPVCNGVKSKQFGLGVSLLERLMANIPIYQPNEYGEYDSRFITQLVRNFRSHEQILTISNELFYNNKLIPQGINDDLCYYALSDDPQVAGFPVMFHGVLGLEVKEGRSPSISNRIEIKTVEDYIVRLLNADMENQVLPEEIGVVSPYALQVQKLKQAFQRHEGWDKIEVGSTETFQGREKRAIIVSTVRSKSEEMDYDRKFRLGFVREPKRFNVIMTRAQAKLIVVGNPLVLSKDKCWSLLIQKAMENSSYTGCSFELTTNYGGVIYYQEVSLNRNKGPRRRGKSRKHNINVLYS